MPTNKTEWVKLIIVIVSACIMVSTTTAGAVWFFADKVYAGDKIHSNTDIIVQSHESRLSAHDSQISDLDSRVDSMETLLPMMQTSQVRIESNQTKQIDKTQEMAETVAGLKVYLESFTVEGDK